MHDSGLIDRATVAGNEPILMVKLPRGKQRTLQIVSELDALWANCKHLKKGDQSADVAWLFYYYYAQMSPLSSHNSEVAFAVTLGQMLGMGRTLERRNKMSQDYESRNYARKIYLGKVENNVLIHRL